MLYDYIIDVDIYSLVRGNLISQPRNLGMGVRTTKSFGVDGLARCHLHQWWTAEEHLRLPFDKYAVVGQRRVVGASCGGRAKNHRARLMPKLAAPSEVSENLAASVEYLELLRQEDTGLPSY